MIAWAKQEKEKKNKNQGKKGGKQRKVTHRKENNDERKVLACVT